MKQNELIYANQNGLYCSQGDFYIDPWRPVDRAIITHAHGDHLRRGHQHYLATQESSYIVKTRAGQDIDLQTVNYGSPVEINGVKVTFYPAGHILGSAQIKVEYRGEIWCVSGDYKITPDQTCTTFEPVKCHTFISECTFGLPIYRWKPQQQIFDEINHWWSHNKSAGIVSIIFAYALGKAQRILAGVNPDIAPIYCHGAVERLNQDYRETGINLPPTQYAGKGNSRTDWQGALVLAPPSAMGSSWLRKFSHKSLAYASGWMMIRGTRRRRAVDQGFVISDHADWNGLLETFHLTGAERILLTHGQTAPMIRYLKERGMNAERLITEYTGEGDDLEIGPLENAEQDVESSDSPIEQMEVN